jgi:hypothetical protein
VATNRTRLRFNVVLAVLGYIGAGLYYGHFLGFNTQTSLTCPVCPHITIVGTPFFRLVVRPFVLGTLNAFLFVSAGWCLRGLIALAKNVFRPTAN